MDWLTGLVEWLGWLVAALDSSPEVEAYNHVMWVIGNLTVALIFVCALTFVVVYPVLFNPMLTTAGRLIWRLVISFLGLGFLAVLGVFVDGQVDWTMFPPDVSWWRPTIRFFIYAFVAYSFGSLIGLLFTRRFHPERVRRAPDDWMVKPRHKSVS